MKTDKNFKINKETKRMMALFKFKNDEERSAFKKSMIEAQATSERVYKENQSQRKRDGSE
jgi:hypothetical protein